MAYALPLSGRSASFSSPQRPDLPTHHAATPNTRVYRCGRCGQPGHRRTNSRCPLRHADKDASSAGAPTAAPGQSRRAGGKKPTKRAAKNDKEASKLHYEEITPKLFTFRDIDDVVNHLLSGEAYSIAERVLWKLQPYFSGLPSLDMKSTRAHPAGTERSAYDFVRVFLPDGCIDTLFRCTKAQLAIKKKPPLVPGEMRQYLGTFYAMSNFTTSLSFIINDLWKYSDLDPGDGIDFRLMNEQRFRDITDALRAAPPPPPATSERWADVMGDLAESIREFERQTSAAARDIAFPPGIHVSGDDDSNPTQSAYVSGKQGNKKKTRKSGFSQEKLASPALHFVYGTRYRERGTGAKANLANLIASMKGTLSVNDPGLDFQSNSCVTMDNGFATPDGMLGLLEQGIRGLGVVRQAVGTRFRSVSYDPLCREGPIVPTSDEVHPAYRKFKNSVSMAEGRFLGQMEVRVAVQVDPETLPLAEIAVRDKATSSKQQKNHTSIVRILTTAQSRDFIEEHANLLAYTRHTHVGVSADTHLHYSDIAVSTSSAAAPIVNDGPTSHARVSDPLEAFVTSDSNSSDDSDGDGSEDDNDEVEMPSQARPRQESPQSPLPLAREPPLCDNPVVSDACMFDTPARHINADGEVEFRSPLDVGSEDTLLASEMAARPVLVPAWFQNGTSSKAPAAVTHSPTADLGASVATSALEQYKIRLHLSCYPLSVGQRTQDWFAARRFTLTGSSATTFISHAKKVQDAQVAVRVSEARWRSNSTQDKAKHDADAATASASAVVDKAFEFALKCWFDNSRRSSRAMLAGHRNEPQVTSAIKQRDYVLAWTEMGVMSYLHDPALSVSPDGGGVLVDAVAQRQLVQRVMDAIVSGTQLSMVEGLHASVADITPDDHTPLDIVNTYGMLERLYVTGEIKTVVAPKSVCKARTRHRQGVALAKTLEANTSSWLYDTVTSTFRCTFGDDLFNTVVPAAHRSQLAHAIIVTGMDGVLYTVASTSATVYNAIVTRGMDPLHPVSHAACESMDEVLDGAASYDRCCAGNAFLSSYRDDLENAISTLALRAWLPGLLGNRDYPSRTQHCPEPPAIIPLKFHLAFQSHWRLTMSVRVHAEDLGPLPPVRKFKSFFQCWYNRTMGGVDLSSKLAMAARPNSVRMRWHALVATKAVAETLQNAWLAKRLVAARDSVETKTLTLQQLRRRLNDTTTWDTFLFEAALGLIAHGNLLQKQHARQQPLRNAVREPDKPQRSLLSKADRARLAACTPVQNRIPWWNTDDGRMLRFCETPGRTHRRVHVRQRGCWCTLCGTHSATNPARRKGHRTVAVCQICRAPLCGSCFQLFHTKHTVEKVNVPTPAHAKSKSRRGSRSTVSGPSPVRSRSSTLPTGFDREGAAQALQQLATVVTVRGPPTKELFVGPKATTAGRGKCVKRKQRASRAVTKQRVGARRTPRHSPVSRRRGMRGTSERDVTAGKTRRVAGLSAAPPAAGATSATTVPAANVGALETEAQAATVAVANAAAAATSVATTSPPTEERGANSVYSAHAADCREFEYFQRQRGMLCGMHAINNALQWEALSDVDVAALWRSPEFQADGARRREMDTAKRDGFQYPHVVWLLHRAAPLLHPDDTIQGLCDTDNRQLYRGRCELGGHEVVGGLGNVEQSIAEFVVKLYSSVIDRADGNFSRIATEADLDSIIVLKDNHYVAAVRLGQKVTDDWYVLDSMKRGPKRVDRFDQVALLRSARWVLAWSSGAAGQWACGRVAPQCAPRHKHFVGSLREFEHGTSHLFRGVDHIASMRDRLWTCTNPTLFLGNAVEVCARVSGVDVRLLDLYSLWPGQKLDDEIINALCGMLQVQEVARLLHLQEEGGIVASPWHLEEDAGGLPSCAVLGDSFWIDKRRSKSERRRYLLQRLSKINMAACAAVVLPVHVEDDHWAAVGVFPSLSSIIVANSIHGCTGHLREDVNMLAEILCGRGSQYRVRQARVPQQRPRSNDCGVYCIQFMKDMVAAALNGTDPAWTQMDNTCHARACIVKELLAYSGPTSAADWQTYSARVVPHGGASASGRRESSGLHGPSNDVCGVQRHEPVGSVRRSRRRVQPRADGATAARQVRRSQRTRRAAVRR